MERKRGFFTHVSILLALAGLLSLELLSTYEASRRARKTATETGNPSETAGPFRYKEVLEEEGLKGEADRLPGSHERLAREVVVSAPHDPLTQR